VSAPDLLGTPEAGRAAVRGGALRVSGFAASVVLSLASAILAFRYLGVEGAGQYVKVLALVAIIGGISDAGLTAIGVRELSVRTGEARDALAANLLGLRIVLTVAGLAVAVAFAGLAGYGTLLVAGTLLAGLGMLLQSVQQTLAISLMSALRLGWVTLADLLRQFVLTVSIVGLVLAGAGLLPFLAAPIAASLLVLLLTARLVRGDIPLVPAFAPAEWRALLREVLPYSVAVAAGVLYFRVAILIVDLVTTDLETGYFGASFRIVDVLVAVPALMMTAAFPIFSRAARDDRERLAYGLSRVFDVSVIAGAGVALTLAIGAPVAIDIVGGAQFEPAVEVLRIQAVAVGAAFLGAFWGYAMLSLRLHREILVINVSALVLVAVLVGVLASSGGARGAAIGTAVAELAIALLYPLVLRRSHPELIPGLGVLPRVAAATLAGALVVLLGLPSLVAMTLAGAIFVAVLLVLRAVPQELLAVVGR